MSSVGDTRYSDLLFCSFYTHKYAMAAGELYDSLLRFKLRNNLYYLRDLGSWFKHVQYKPAFIKNTLATTNADVVWLDADSVVKQYPKRLFLLVYENYDIAAFRFAPSDDQYAKMCSGTVYFKNNKVTRAVVDRWCQITEERVKEDPKTWDQVTLEDALMESEECKVLVLPASYCMWDDVRTTFPTIDPVIEHKQMSRQILREQGFDNA